MRAAALAAMLVAALGASAAHAAIVVTDFSAQVRESDQATFRLPLELPFSPSLTAVADGRTSAAAGAGLSR